MPIYAQLHDDHIGDTSPLTGVLADLETHVRNVVRDPATATPPLFSSAEIVDFLAEGQREVAFRTYCIQDSSTPVDTMGLPISVVQQMNGTGSYAISSKIILVESVRRGVDNKFLSMTSARELSESQPQWRTNTGTPAKAFLTTEAGAKNLWLCPQPTADDTLYLSVRRLPLVDLSIANPAPEISDIYYKAMEIWAIYRCYLKADTEIYSLPSAQSFLGMFTGMVGERPSLNVERVMFEEAHTMNVMPRMRHR